jgi:hypothetical protein
LLSHGAVPRGPRREWPDFATEVSDDNKREIQLRISKAVFGAAPQAGDWVGKMVAEVLGLDIKSG